jgi:hypothetical protein
VAVVDASLSMLDVTDSSVDGGGDDSTNVVSAVLDTPSAIDALPSRFAGETITAIIRQVAIYHEARVDDHWRGYLRMGGTARIVRGPLGDENCPARPDRRDTGWYQIEGDGYICASRGAVLTRHLTREMRGRFTSAPLLDAGMPYRYALAPGPAILYRAQPSVADEQATEPERFAAPGTPRRGSSAIVHTTSGRPPTVEELEGREGTPVLRRLTRGMYVSVDRAVRTASGALFWRTVANGYVRAGTVHLVNAPPLRGMELNGDVALPLAYVITEGAAVRRLGDDNIMYQMVRAPRLSGYALADLTPFRWRDEDFFRLRDGRFLKAREVTVVTAHDPPEDLAPGEKWIDVNLDHQSLVAYEGARPVFATIVATGVAAPNDPANNYETIQGAFRIQQKHIATTMDGNTATNGAYSIEDVPWAMYFEQSFALHGTYWHTGFGAVHSHGCVNLAPDDARWVFAWTSPAVPRGWHAVLATERDPGTRVYVHYDRQRLGERGGPSVVPGH